METKARAKLCVNSGSESRIVMRKGVQICPTCRPGGGFHWNGPGKQRLERGRRERLSGSHALRTKRRV